MLIGTCCAGPLLGTKAWLRYNGHRRPHQSAPRRESKEAASVGEEAKLLVSGISASLRLFEEAMAQDDRTTLAVT